MSLSRSFFDDIKARLLHLNVPIILGGDLNLTIDILDRSSTTPPTSNQLLSSNYITDFMKDLNVVDGWRIRNSSVRDYTFFSSHH